MNRVMLVAVGDKEWPTPAIKGICAGRVIVNCATHNPIAHILGEVCIHLNGYSQRDKAKIKKKYGYDHIYPLVHQRNIVPILTHESIHCVLQDLGFEGRTDGLDQVAANVPETRKILSS